ncbi:MAG: OmpA family protein [Prevotella sp.]|nr:OmpA family protein [Prevotella sp.]
MKKIAMFIAAAAMAVSANAQKTVVTASKAGDNIYVGVNGGATTVFTGDNAFSAFQPNFGIRVGKNFTTVFGVALDLGSQMNAHKSDCPAGLGNKTFFNNVEANLLGTANLMNLFAGYKGEPRTFEVIALGGFGWTHDFPSDYDRVNTKLALDFAYNFGGAKQWQAYVEPAITYRSAAAVNNFKYNLRDADFSLKAGVNYKFGCSNGKHNFAIEQLRDQSEIDGLNAKINSLRSDVDAAKAAAAAKDAKIAELQKALTDCQNKPAPVVEKKAANLQPSVVFAQGKSVVQKSQLANIEMIAKYMQNNKGSKVKISGYASPEGSKEFNQKLSEKRAEAVKTILVKKYKIAADRIETEGLGATDKLFDQVEFNRVALFNDTTK